jgi:hypothetical protein
MRVLARFPWLKHRDRLRRADNVILQLTTTTTNDEEEA